MNAKSPTQTPHTQLRVPRIERSRTARSSLPGNSAATTAAGHRISGFGFLSIFGFRFSDLPCLLLALAAGASLTGCSFLKPAHATERHFVLAPLPATERATATPGALAVGVGQVKLPAYLFNTSLAVRQGANEIDYLPRALWAERLDTGVQRVLAANLAALLPTDQIRLSAWRSEEVAAEVYVTIEQFDVDFSGRGVLVAAWRILAPGGAKTLKTGESRLSRQGPAPDANPSGAIGTLSDLVAEQSRQLAQAIAEVTPTRPMAPVTK
jgi:uncharacterized protein